MVKRFGRLDCNRYGAHLLPGADILTRADTDMDAACCCEVISGYLPKLTDMNEAARNWVRAKNVPSILHAELDSMFTIVYADNDNVFGLGALAGAESEP